MMETVGARIKAFREFHNLTQKDVFQATHGEIKQTTLSAVENNQAKPGFETLTALLDAYPVLSPDWLLMGVGSMTRDGRTLTPIPAQQPDYTSGQGTVNTVVETLLRDRLADKQVIIDMLTAEVAELRGKPFDSSETAGELPTDPNDPRFSAGVAPMPMLRPQVPGFRRKQEAAELS